MGYILEKPDSLFGTLFQTTIEDLAARSFSAANQKPENYDSFIAAYSAIIRLLSQDYGVCNNVYSKIRPEIHEGYDLDFVLHTLETAPDLKAVDLFIATDAIRRLNSILESGGDKAKFTAAVLNNIPTFASQAAYNNYDQAIQDLSTQLESYLDGKLSDKDAKEFYQQDVNFVFRDALAAFLVFSPLEHRQHGQAWSTLANNEVQKIFA